VGWSVVGIWHRLGAVSLSVLMWSQTVCAQTVAPSQVTPELSPENRPAEQPIIEQSLTSDVVNFDVQDDTLLTVADVAVRFDGEQTPAEIEAFAAQLRGQRLSLRQIIAAARDLERAFHEQGYILRRVVFPPQTFTDGGTLQVEVIDGYIERIDTAALSPRVAAIIERRIGKLLRTPGLRLTDIERALLIANELPGMRLRSALSQGEETGGVLLTVESDFAATSASFQINNYLPASLGDWQFGATLARNNTLGIGESIYVRIGGDANRNLTRDRRPGFGFVGGGVQLPIDNDGKSIAFDGIVSRSSTQASVGVPAIDGRLTQGSVRINVLPVLNRRARVGFEVALESITQSLEAADFDVELTRDDYRAARLGVITDRAIGSSRVLFNAQLSAGVGGRSASPDPTSVGLSRQGASPSFAKLSADALLQVPVGALRFDLTMRGQTGFGDPMLLSEQFSLDAPNAISTPVSGRFLVDSGQTSRLELVAPGVIKPIPRLHPYLFAAQGYGTRALPTAVESRSVFAGAFGLGARLGVGPIELDFEVGSQVAREFVTDWSEHARLTLRIRQ
jgi:hemolysin activation/secretion protein